MQIEKDPKSEPDGNALITPISIHDDHELERIVVKNISHFLLEPDEFQILKQATIGNSMIEKGIEYVIGVWKNSNDEFVVVSIYQISDGKQSYLNNLFDYCRVGDCISDLPMDFHEARRISIK